MIPRYFASLLFWDKVLIVLFILFSVFLVTVLVILSAPEIRRKAIRRLTVWIAKLEDINAQMRDDEPFDPSWMKYNEWKETRPWQKRKLR